MGTIILDIFDNPVTAFSGHSFWLLENGNSNAVYYASDIGVKETINEDSIPSSVKLPTVTDADAGKFLRVSADGKWVAESIANAEEASF